MISRRIRDHPVGPGGRAGIGRSHGVGARRGGRGRTRASRPGGRPARALVLALADVRRAGRSRYGGSGDVGGAPGRSSRRRRGRRGRHARQIGRGRGCRGARALGGHQRLSRGWRRSPRTARRAPLQRRRVAVHVHELGGAAVHASDDFRDRCFGASALVSPGLSASRHQPRVDHHRGERQRAPGRGGAAPLAAGPATVQALFSRRALRVDEVEAWLARRPASNAAPPWPDTYRQIFTTSVERPR